jgi:hypothetical protein
LHEFAAAGIVTTGTAIAIVATATSTPTTLDMIDLYVKMFSNET